MSDDWLTILGWCVLNGALALLLAPLYEGIMRKLKATIHSRIGPPVTQPYLDLRKLLVKEDLRTATGLLYGVAPALTLGSTLLLAMFIPMGRAPPLGFGGDLILVLYLVTMGTVLVMLTGLASASPYASVGSSREMMLTFCLEPIAAIALVVGAHKAGSLSLGSILDWHAANGPCVSMLVAGFAFLLALQGHSAKLPFDVAEADQEIMGGPLVEQSGPRLALFRWAMWVKQLVLTVLFVEIFIPWPRTGLFLVDLVLALAKALVVLLVVALVDVVNPRLRIDQSMSYFMRIGLVSLGALAFAMIGT
jgi:formate hydrogenlyase subunit 4